MKIEEQVLSIKQMKYLQKLGVDTSDASMYWKTFPTETGYYDYQGYHGTDIQDEAELVIDKEIDDDAEYIPTYTIGNLIEKLPKYFHAKENPIEMCAINGNGAFAVDYFNIAKSCKKDSTIKNALYKLFCWVAEKHKELLEVKK